MPLFVIALLVGWFMPAADHDAAPAPAPKFAPAKPAQLTTAKAPTTSFAASDSDGITLNRAIDGHFYAQGQADGAAVTFMVDTGASVVALTDKDAERLGHYTHPGELSVIGRGAGGEVSGKPVIIRRLAIGEIYADNVPAVIIPNGLHVSLLGQSFLSRIAHVTIADNRMTLKN